MTQRTKNVFANTLLAVLAMAVICHRLTGRLNAFIILTLIWAIVYLCVWTAGDGRRALAFCEEDDKATDNNG